MIDIKKILVAIVFFIFSYEFIVVFPDLEIISLYSLKLIYRILLFLIACFEISKFSTIIKECKKSTDARFVILNVCVMLSYTSYVCVFVYVLFNYLSPE